MNHLSLFSGIGGLDLAAEWAGFRTVAFVERDPYCQRVLAKRWPGVQIFNDVRAVPDPTRLEDWGLQQPGVPADVGASGKRITVVSGGFPCQPHSVAGKRQASADDRDLWPEVARVLREIRPRWFVGENVRGLLHSESGRFFGGILGDLADLGYRVGWGVWGASDVGALHQRERVFIVAHAPWDVQSEPAASGAERERTRAGSEPGDVPDTNGSRLAQRVVQPGRAGRAGSAHQGEDARLGGQVPDADRGRQQEREELDGDPSQDPPDGRSRWEHVDGHRSAAGWEFEPDVGRVAHGIPSRVDRLRSLGNAVVPQQAYPIFKAIAEIEMRQESLQGDVSK